MKTHIPSWLWLKFYFDKGLGVTSYAKYLIAIFGLYSIGKDIDINYTIAFGLIYILCCFVIGYLWVRSKLQDAENEIQNRLNPFQREVRAKLSNGKVYNQTRPIKSRCFK